ncbi:carbon-nitrogen hydrolase family protein [Aquicoccus sp.]|uniref:carbon-nitrogen hydrolase family protein n=1 Tax=Aquicoccus sp. TaxID=2055851 RepID=UPI003563333C
MQDDETLRLMACQITVPEMTSAAERDAHLAATVAKIEAQLDRQEAELVVLPELSSIDYSRATFARLDALAEPLDGPSFQAWRRVAMAHGVHVAFGFARADAGGPFICTAVVGPDGQLMGYYDKIHLAQYGASMEKEYFRRGDHVFTFEVKGFRLAPIICYDIRIPELSRALVTEHGVDAILHCGAYFRDESFHTWHPFAITRALENQVFFLSLNRAGASYGNSLFCRPWMDEVTQPVAFPEHDEAFRIVTLTRAEIDAARAGYSFLKDRLPDYRLPMIAPNGPRK